MSAEGIVESGNFIFTLTSIEGVVVIDVRRFVDERGFFMETYRHDNFVAGGIDTVFVQDNHSASRRGVLRGLHFQIEHPQAKLVRVIEGEVFKMDSMPIKSGRVLTQQEMTDLLARLLAIPDNRYTPNGQLVYTQMNVDQIAKMF